MYEKTIEFIREIYAREGFIPLHEPRFWGNEKQYVLDAIDSTFVSSVGEYVTRFEKMICGISGAKFCVATVNGTAALHIGLMLAGVRPDDEVLTQAISFVATSNAISYCEARPVFIDVDADTMGMGPRKLEAFLEKNTTMARDGCCRSRLSGKKVTACVPMHTFGHPCRIDEIVEICARYNIAVVEDSAESLGSSYKGRHTGTFGRAGIYSFNGNKTVTCGGGGAIVTDDENLSSRAKHLTTTAKISHPYEYIHDQVGYNYRLPNLNAALACAQLEQLDGFIRSKRGLAQKYEEFFQALGIPFFKEPPEACSNYWLNSVMLPNREERDRFLAMTNGAGVMTRPIWRLTNKLPIFEGCISDGLETSHWLEDRVVNIPSSVPIDPAFQG
jgi:aminotransferase in exopolysaccharide biosynthesis